MAYASDSFRIIFTSSKRSNRGVIAPTLGYPMHRDCREGLKHGIGGFSIRGYRKVQSYSRVRQFQHSHAIDDTRNIGSGPARRGFAIEYAHRSWLTGLCFKIFRLLPQGLKSAGSTIGIVLIGLLSQGICSRIRLRSSSGILSSDGFMSLPPAI